MDGDAKAMALQVKRDAIEKLISQHQALVNEIITLPPEQWMKRVFLYAQARVVEANIQMVCSTSAESLFESTSSSSSEIDLSKATDAEIKSAVDREIRLVVNSDPVLSAKIADMVKANGTQT